MKILFLIIIFTLTACSSNPPEIPTNSQEQYVETTSQALNKKIQKTAPQQFTIETTKDGHEEAIKELNQNLTYYCMKKKTVNNFNSEQQCVNFVQNSLDACEKKFNKANKQLIQCIKQKLKLK